MTFPHVPPVFRKDKGREQKRYRVRVYEREGRER
jgi:hypothetical protein